MKRRPQAKKSAPKKTVAKKNPAAPKRKASPKAAAPKARRPVAAPSRPQAEAYTPKPIAGTGWPAFRYPL